MIWSSEVVAALAGALVGAGISSVSTYYLARRTNRAAAGGRMRAAFVPELSIIRATPSGESVKLENILTGALDVDRMLRKAYGRHAAAIEEYRPFVPVWQRAAFQAAWQEYYLEGGSISFTYYMVAKDGHEEFCRRVEAIFAFTDI